jgi:hypothetical protein
VIHRFARIRASRPFEAGQNTCRHCDARWRAHMGKGNQG